MKFNEEANGIINMIMYCLIGIAYIVMAYVWKNTLTKIIIATCGIFLLVMNLLHESSILNVIGIFCLVIPMLISRFSKETNTEMEIIEH